VILVGPTAQWGDCYQVRAERAQQLFNLNASITVNTAVITAQSTGGGDAGRACQGPAVFPVQLAPG
jgi:hypothetical protein